VSDDVCSIIVSTAIWNRGGDGSANRKWLAVAGSPLREGFPTPVVDAVVVNGGSLKVVMRLRNEFE